MTDQTEREKIGQAIYEAMPSSYNINGDLRATWDSVRRDYPEMCEIYCKAGEAARAALSGGAVSQDALANECDREAENISPSGTYHVAQLLKRVAIALRTPQQPSSDHIARDDTPTDPEAGAPEQPSSERDLIVRFLHWWTTDSRVPFDVEHINRPEKGGEIADAFLGSHQEPKQTWVNPDDHEEQP